MGGVKKSSFAAGNCGCGRSTLGASFSGVIALKCLATSRVAPIGSLSVRLRAARSAENFLRVVFGVYESILPFSSSSDTDGSDGELDRELEDEAERSGEIAVFSVVRSLPLPIGEMLRERDLRSEAGRT